MKDLINLNGVELLDKTQQKTINAGESRGSCRRDKRCDPFCSPGSLAIYINPHCCACC